MIHNFTTICYTCILQTNEPLFFLQEHYDELFVKKVYSVPLLSIHEALRGNQPGEAVRVQYNDKQGYKAMAKQLGLMEDLKVS